MASWDHNTASARQQLDDEICQGLIWVIEQAVSGPYNLRGDTSLVVEVTDAIQCRVSTHEDRRGFRVEGRRDHDPAIRVIVKSGSGVAAGDRVYIRRQAAVDDGFTAHVEQVRPQGSAGVGEVILAHMTEVQPEVTVE